ncbi:hypothetical protein DFH07DRAFT_828072 [Mycena maculata]|uniref:Uncharacterized protein n=1 Tax=Mycena maculata TaxID=230809 RepID=A0AAD7N8Q4_9AGAR|nr:hypothetical protein DFH07DRAFT_828072 [Mycena maculata]
MCDTLAQNAETNAITGSSSVSADYTMPVLNSIASWQKNPNGATPAFSWKNPSKVPDISMTFGEMALVKFVPGAWFDAFQSAGAAANPPSPDPATAVFAKYFGTAQSAARYNNQALVVYKPKIVLNFASEADYNGAKSTLSSKGMWQSVSGSTASVYLTY